MYFHMPRVNIQNMPPSCFNQSISLIVYEANRFMSTVAWLKDVMFSALKGIYLEKNEQYGQKKIIGSNVLSYMSCSKNENNYFYNCCPNYTAALFTFWINCNDRLPPFPKIRFPKTCLTFRFLLISKLLCHFQIMLRWIIVTHINTSLIFRMIDCG